MNFRENSMAILHYQPYDKMPVVSFGYWNETLDKWADEGYITREEAEGYARYGDNSEADRSVMKKLGFDFNWGSTVGGNILLFPSFPREVLKENPDGSRIVRNSDGLIIKEKPGTVSIPSQIGTSLKDRKAWEELYLPRLQWDPKRVNYEALRALPKKKDRQTPLGLYVGSMFGNVRNLLGVEELSYLYADDEDLFREIVDTVCGLCLKTAEEILSTGAEFDFGHFWEDICFKNGPLVNPAVFRELTGPWYKKITDLLKEHGIDIVSLDCDGCIDLLIPTWIENGVNTMFPMEVGTWHASIAPWREKYGRALRGVGGMDKRVFSQDKEAVDREVDRLVKLIRLGGYIPCPDHRIAPDAKFPLVQYYCSRMQELRAEDLYPDA